MWNVACNMLRATVSIPQGPKQDSQAISQSGCTTTKGPVTSRTSPSFSGHQS